MKLKSKQLIYTSENIIIESDMPLDGGISTGNFSLEQYQDSGTYINIGIASVSVSGANCTVVPTVTLQNNKIYVLTAFAIKNADQTETIPAQIFRFLSVDKPSIYNTNNIYAKLDGLQKVLSTEYLLKNQEDYTIEFNPSDFNYETNGYENSTELVSIQNNKKMLDLLIGQYFTEYKPFYDAINSRPSNIIYEEDYINNLHLIFMNNIAKWYSMKGNQTFIEIMVNLYAKYLGYNILSVVEDPQHNFRYRVSASIPEIEWNRYIKPLVHPMGWDDIYNEITSLIDGFYFQPYDLQRRMREQWALDCVSFLDAEAYSDQYTPHYRRIKNLYHKAGNIEYENVHSHEHNNHPPCTFQSVADQYKFNMNLNSHTTGVDYHQQAIFKQLKDLKNIKFFIDRLNKTITADFKFTGVANEYLYKHFVGNCLTDIKQSLLSKITIPFNNSDILVLELKKNDWSQEVIRIDEMALVPHTDGVLSYNINQKREKYLTIRSNNNKAYQYNSIAVNTFASSYNASSLGYTKDFQYTFAVSSSTVSAAFKSEFDTSTSFTVSGVPFVCDGTNFKRETVKYKKHGMMKYKWKLYTSSKLIQEVDTYINTFSFNVPVADVAASNVELTIYYKNGSYKLNNKAICV